MNDIEALFDRLKPENSDLAAGERDAWLVNAQLLLDSLQGQNAKKKRETITALLAARLEGRSDESVWKLRQTCSRSVFHEKWKHDPVFARVLAELERLTMEWRSQYALRSLRRSAEELAFAAPAAVQQVVEKLTSADPNVSLKAAFGILDRAGMDTAQKTSVTQTVKGYVVVSPDDWDEDTDETTGGSHL